MARCLYSGLGTIKLEDSLNLRITLVEMQVSHISEWEFITFFNSRATGFHRWAKLQVSDLNFFTRKTFLLKIKLGLSSSQPQAVNLSGTI